MEGIMARLSLVILALAGLLVTVSDSTMAAQSNSGAATTSGAGSIAPNPSNAFTEDQERQAQDAARRAGYKVGRATWAQEGILFFKITRDGRDYQVTVTPQGEVFEAPLPRPFQ